MIAKVPESAHWLSNIGLAIIFNDFPPEEMRPFVINFIRRIYGSFIAYQSARQDVIELVKDGNGRWSPYFSALNHFESTIAQLYLALDAIRKFSNHNFFANGDGSFEELLNRIYNTSKHTLPNAEIPVWFTNDSIACNSAELKFEEIEHFMELMANVVTGLYNRDIATKSLHP